MNDQGPLSGPSATRSGGRLSEVSDPTRRAATFAAVDAEFEIRERLVAILDALDAGDVQLAAGNVRMLLDDLDPRGSAVTDRRVTTFDLERHRREKIARLERENDMLRAHRAQLERLLATALRIAVGKTGLDPLVLCRVLEELDRTETPAELAFRVLRKTA